MVFVFFLNIRPFRFQKQMVKLWNNLTGTKWASLNHAVFLCTQCTIIHLKNNISNIRAINFHNNTSWEPEEITLLENMGNPRTKRTYNSTMRESKEMFICAKYGQVHFLTLIFEYFIKQLNFMLPSFQLQSKSSSERASSSTHSSDTSLIDVGSNSSIPLSTSIDGPSNNDPRDRTRRNKNLASTETEPIRKYYVNVEISRMSVRSKCFSMINNRNTIIKSSLIIEGANNLRID